MNESCIFFSSFFFFLNITIIKIFIYLFTDIFFWKIKYPKYLEFFNTKTIKIMVYALMVNRAWISIVHDESKKSVSHVRGGLTYLKGHCIPPYTRGTRLYECLPITGSLDTDCVSWLKVPAAYDFNCHRKLDGDKYRTRLSVHVQNALYCIKLVIYVAYGSVTAAVLGVTPRIRVANWLWVRDFQRSL